MLRLRFFLVVLFLLLLGACQTDSDHETLTFSTWGSPIEMEILTPLLDEFRAQHPEIRLELMHIPDKYFQKLHTLISANLAPDVMFLNNFQFPLYASNGAFLDLSEYLAQGPLKKQAFFKQSLEGFQWEGQQQGVPRDVSNLVVYYNKDLFKKHGIPLPQADWSYEDMVSLAKRFPQDSDQDGKRDLYGMSFHKYFLFWSPYLWSAGGDFFNAERSQLALHTPEALQGLQNHADLRHKHHIAPTRVEAGNRSMSQLFSDGHLAMLFDGRWRVPTFRKNISFDWDILPFPAGAAGSIVDADASGWVISKKTRHPEKAWELVSFLASKQASMAFSKPGLIIPARKDVAHSDTFLAPDQKPASAQYFITALEKGKATPSTPYWNEIIEEINQALAPLWEGRMEAQEAVEGLDKKLERLL